MGDTARWDEVLGVDPASRSEALARGRATNKAKWAKWREDHPKPPPKPRRPRKATLWGWGSRVDLCKPEFVTPRTVAELGEQLSEYYAAARIYRCRAETAESACVQLHAAVDALEAQVEWLADGRALAARVEALEGELAATHEELVAVAERSRTRTEGLTAELEAAKAEAAYWHERFDGEV